MKGGQCFFFNDTATTEIYTLSLHDALPILIAYLQVIDNPFDAVSLTRIANRPRRGIGDTTLARLQSYATAQGISLWEARSEEHTSELQSRQYLVCRLLLEKKKQSISSHSAP